MITDTPGATLLSRRSVFILYTGIILKLKVTENSFQWEHATTTINRTRKYITTCYTPAIFTNFEEKQYNRLWKEAARLLVLADRIALRFVYPERFNRYNVFLVMRDVKIFFSQKRRDRDCLINCYPISVLTSNQIRT